MPKRSTDKTLGFEEAIEQLEAIIDRVESGEVGLEDAIKQYEAGRKLIDRCRKVLDKAQRKIQTLTPDEEGNLMAPGATPDPSSEAGDTHDA